MSAKEQTMLHCVWVELEKNMLRYPQISTVRLGLKVVLLKRQLSREDDTIGVSVKRQLSPYIPV